MNTDIVELSRLIQLPATPKSAKWIRTSPQVRGLVGPTDYTVVALLEFPDSEMENVRAKLQNNNPPIDSEPMGLSDAEAQTLFTSAESLRWQRPSPGSVIVPGETFGPGPFAKSPYLQGKVSLVEGKPNHVLIVLYTS